MDLEKRMRARYKSRALVLLLLLFEISVNSYKSLTKMRNLGGLWRNILQSVKNLSRLGRRKCEII